MLLDYGLQVFLSWGLHGIIGTQLHRANLQCAVSSQYATPFLAYNILDKLLIFFSSLSLSKHFTSSDHSSLLSDVSHT